MSSVCQKIIVKNWIFERGASVQFIFWYFFCWYCLRGEFAYLFDVLNSLKALFYRNGSLLDEKCKKILCAALVQPYIDYCCSSWYSGVSSHFKQRLDTLQRKMVRFVYALGFREHVGNSHLRELSWLSIPDRVSFFKLLQLFKIRHDLAPSYLKANLVDVSLTHAHNTRGSTSNFHVSHAVSVSHDTFSYSAVTLWNALSPHLKLIEKLPVFKKRLKESLFSRYEWLKRIQRPIWTLHI